MKLITAIIRAEKLNEVIEALMDHRVHGLTVTEVRGFGRQFGQPAPGIDPDLGLPRSVALLPKVRLELVVLDDDADALAEVVAKHARTGMIGDGKIWVSDVGSVLRVRTGDRDLAALTSAQLRIRPPGRRYGALGSPGQHRPLGQRRQDRSDARGRADRQHGSDGARRSDRQD